MFLPDPTASHRAYLLDVFQGELNLLRIDPSRKWQEKWVPADDSGKHAAPLCAMASYLPSLEQARQALDVMVRAGLREVRVRQGHLADDGVLDHVHAHMPELVMAYANAGIGLTAREGGLRMLHIAAAAGLYPLVRRILSACDVEALGDRHACPPPVRFPDPDEPDAQAYDAAFEMAVADTAFLSAAGVVWEVPALNQAMDEDTRVMGWQILNRWGAWASSVGYEMPVMLAKMILARVHASLSVNAGECLLYAPLRETVLLAIQRNMPVSAWETLADTTTQVPGAWQALAAHHEALLIAQGTVQAAGAAQGRRL